MFVYVQDKEGRPLMPTKRLGMVRRWLKQGQAVRVRRVPFTICLLSTEGGYTQPLRAGLDAGTAHVGVSVLSEREEVYSAEVSLRTDISDLMTERCRFRRTRRSRKLRYRQPRFHNRVHSDELPPSLRAKVDESLKVIALVQSILPIVSWTLELGNFDMHKLVNPDVEGVAYQQGPQYGYYNAREYVLWRDGHTCQACKGKSKAVCLQVHHIRPRSEGGSDRPDNLITLCVTCHDKHHHQRPLKLKAPPPLRDSTQFNILKSYLKRATAHLQPAITYGYLTKAIRHELGLPKSHRSDAFVIAGGRSQSQMQDYYLARFVRKQNRKQRKGVRSHIPNTIPSAFGFKRGQRVRLDNGQQGFIVGLRSTGYFDVRRLDGTVLHHSAKHSTLRPLDKALTLQIEHYIQKGAAHSSPR